MLKQRLITAAILIPLVIWGILGLPTSYLLAVLALFVLQGAWEWTRLVGWKAQSHRIVFVVVIASLVLNGYFFLQYGSASLVLFAVSLVWWLWGIGRIVRYRGEPGVETRNWLVNALHGVVILVPTWVALGYLHSLGEHGPYLLIMLMVLIWGADSGAYFAGRKFGKRKLAPFVSPGKSIEGVLGGVLASLVFALIGGWLLGYDSGKALGLFVLLSLITVLLSVEGDLMESLYKRRAGVKDSGTLLPGHGGVLDRIDSMTAAAPVFALGIWALEVVA
ncbi:MAG: phosphatidate cytidylyltransferase [Gammaproteobacteria bacterium]|nr:phosphatidate cytidylyltransferase [Gammaproteobacteria bacterium]